MKASSLEILENAHLPPPQAKAILQEMDAELEGSALATKAGLVTTEEKLIGKIEAAAAGLRAEMAEMKSEIIKWMFLFWIGQSASVLAIVKFLK